MGPYGRKKVDGNEESFFPYNPLHPLHRELLSRLARPSPIPSYTHLRSIPPSQPADIANLTDAKTCISAKFVY